MDIDNTTNNDDLLSVTNSDLHNDPHNTSTVNVNVNGNTSRRDTNKHYKQYRPPTVVEYKPIGYITDINYGVLLNDQVSTFADKYKAAMQSYKQRLPTVQGQYTSMEHLYKLYRYVVHRGGFFAACKCNLWYEIASNVGFNRYNREPHDCYNYYIQYLLRFELNNQYEDNTSPQIKFNVSFEQLQSQIHDILEHMPEPPKHLIKPDNEFTYKQQHAALDHTQTLQQQQQTTQQATKSSIQQKREVTLPYTLIQQIISYLRCNTYNEHVYALNHLTNIVSESIEQSKVYNNTTAITLYTTEQIDLWKHNAILHYYNNILLNDIFILPSYNYNVLTQILQQPVLINSLLHLLDNTIQDISINTYDDSLFYDQYSIIYHIISLLYSMLQNEQVGSLLLSHSVIVDLCIDILYKEINNIELIQTTLLILPQYISTGQYNYTAVMLLQYIEQFITKHITLLCQHNANIPLDVQHELINIIQLCSYIISYFIEHNIDILSHVSVDYIDNLLVYSCIYDLPLTIRYACLNVIRMLIQHNKKASQLHYNIHYLIGLLNDTVYYIQCTTANILYNLYKYNDNRDQLLQQLRGYETSLVYVSSCDVKIATYLTPLLSDINNSYT